MFLLLKTHRLSSDRPNFDRRYRGRDDPQVHRRDRDRQWQLDECRRQVERQYFWVRPFCL